MFHLLACLYLLVRGVPGRPTEKMIPAAQGEVKALFQLVKQTLWEENVSLTSLSCAEQSTQHQRWTSLRLKNRNLTSFPACLPELLENLDLSTNLLTELNSQNLTYLPKLQVLSLRQNKIQQVTWGASSLPSLQFLDLSFNFLSVVPACRTSSLANLTWLSLAGNPIAEIQAFDFACYPQLQFLNLSSTWLGQEGQEGIGENAFAMTLLPGDTNERAENAISVLDLSATALDSIHQKWIKDLPSLTSLYLTKMIRLRSLDAAVFKDVPKLKILDCQGSPALSLVKTERFSQTPHLTFLIFQNCNLSSFGAWNLSSSDRLVVNLYGNPLECNCTTSWLLSQPERIVLQRASETVCYESSATSSARSVPLLDLHRGCQSPKNPSPTPQMTQDKLYNMSFPFTKDIKPDSRTVSQEWAGSSVAPQSITLTWWDLRKQTSVKVDIPAIKEDVYGSTGSPFAAPTVTSASVTWAKAVQTGGNVADVALKEQDTTTSNSIVHPEGTQQPSAVLSPTSEARGSDFSQVPGDLFSPQSAASLAQTEPPPQNPSQVVSHPNPASMIATLYYEDDYDYEERQKGPVTSRVGPCDYDPCRHHQKPCFELQTLSRCLCPGLSGELSVPDPPRLREVSEIQDTSAEIQWCAPNSVVRFYQLAYRLTGKMKNYSVSGEIYATARQYTLYNLQPGSAYQVCIMASNQAGSSQMTDNAPPSCSNFTTKTSYKSIFAALCATSGLLVVLALLLSGWLCSKCKAPNIEQLNTHLVSFKNPAFDNSMQ